MELAWILLRQNITMVIYMVIGYFLYSKKLITKNGSGELGKLVLYIVMPAVIIKAYMMDFSLQALRRLGLSMAAAAVCLLLSMLVSRLAFRKHPIEHFGCAFSNAGFIGIPLIQAALGREAVFYVSSFVAFLNILQWTYGVYVMTGDRKRISVKKIVTNPVVIGFMIGIAVFFLPVQPPLVLTSAVNAISAMNAPMAMIILGIYLAQLPLKEMLKGKHVYLCTLLRLVVIPLLSMAVLSLIPAEYNVIKMAVLIAAAAPVGSNVAIFAQINEKDYTEAVKSICISTVLCIFTMPMIVWIANTLWK